jgi:hypothetical protein
MTARLIILSLAVLGISSCEKVKDIADKTSNAVKKEIAAKIGEGANKVDPELEKLVDRTPEGVIFRKDLPFPKRLEVRTTQRAVLAGRFVQSSAIGSESTVVNGTEIRVTKLERAGDQIRYTLEQSSFSKPSEENPDGEKPAGNLLDQVAPAPKPWVLKKADGRWISDEQNGFRATSVVRQLAPVFDVLLEENGLSGRSLWFAKRRLKVGDELDVSTKSLPMLVSGDAKGSAKIKLESFESVEGHPCGVFSITGDYRRSGFPNFEGNLTDEDVTIETGKIWLSLIYPLILKEDFEIIQTIHSGQRGGFDVRGQGTVKMSVTRAWKALE